MTTRKTSKKKVFYGSKEFKRDLEKTLQDVTFGELIKSYRKEEKMTLKKLADILETTPAGICDLEKGRKIPSVKRAWKIASTLMMHEPFCVQIALQDQLREQGLDLKVSISS